MKKKLLLLLTFFTVNIACFSQKGKIFFETNYNSFSHSCLSEFQQEFVDDLPEQIPIATTDDFPGNIGFTLGYEFVEEQTSFFVNYNSTGGKLSYSDYSGVIRLEQRLSGITVGGMYHLNLDDEERFKIGFRGFITFSGLTVDSFIQIENDLAQDKIDLSSIDFGIGVSFLYEYPVSFFILRAQIGYDAVIGGKLNFDSIDNAHLINNAGEEVNTGWSGFRSGIGIAIPIN